MGLGTVHLAKKAQTGSILLGKILIAKFTSNVDLDEMAHSEPPHLDLRCLPISL